MSDYNGFGTESEQGEPVDGPTMLPTWWIKMEGIGNVPMAIPIDGWEAVSMEEANERTILLR